MIKLTEFELQVKCVKYLEQLKTQGRIDLFTSIPNSTFTKSWAVKRKNTLSGVRAGLCDLLIVIRGIPYFIELKTLKGTLQQTQKEWIKKLNSRFMLAYIACSFEEFTLLIEDCIDSSLAQIKFEDTRYAKAKMKGYKMVSKLK